MNNESVLKQEKDWVQFLETLEDEALWENILKDQEDILMEEITVHCICGVY